MAKKVLILTVAAIYKQKNAQNWPVHNVLAIPQE